MVPASRESLTTDPAVRFEFGMGTKGVEVAVRILRALFALTLKQTAC